MPSIGTGLQATYLSPSWSLQGNVKKRLGEDGGMREVNEEKRQGRHSPLWRFLLPPSQAFSPDSNPFKAGHV